MTPLKTASVTIRLTENEHKALKIAATLRRCPTSHVLRLAMRSWLYSRRGDVRKALEERS
jgi:hypothetical protein